VENTTATVQYCNEVCKDGAQETVTVKGKKLVHVYTATGIMQHF